MSGHLAAMAAESSTKTETDTASPGIAGLEKEKEGGEDILGRLLEESQKGPGKKRGARIRMERSRGMT